MKDKHDLIIWLFLSNIQLRVYQDFLKLDSVREVCMSYSLFKNADADLLS